MISQKTAFLKVPTASEKQNIQTEVGWMTLRDMPQVITIEQKSFDYAWTEEDFLCCLRSRNCIGMVAKHLNYVVGFMIYELHKDRLHVLNFAVHSDFRRCGVGSAMVSKLVNKLSQQGRQAITLEVRETNLAAQLFFKHQSFRAQSIFHRYYEDSHEDAYLMRYQLYGHDINDRCVLVNRISKFQDDMRSSPD